jgi:hypothetical protein
VDSAVKPTKKTVAVTLIKATVFILTTATVIAVRVCVLKNADKNLKYYNQAVIILKSY